MDNNIDFKDLWKKQIISQPDIVDLQERVKQFKRAGVRSIWKTNILLAGTSAFMIFVWYYYQPEFISTKIGIILGILAMVIYVGVYNRLLGIYKDSDATRDNYEYLQQLILIRKRQQFIQSTILSWYFVLLMTGICLYMYEYASRMTVLYALLTYGITLLWIGFNWFYLRPKQIQKQKEKIDSLIEKLELVNEQLEL
ncbi:hypothetical protein GJU43_14675 [Flavobacterium sp. LC2016-23]|uniref:hypothetical protein n=1 Tax=Flavobacterium sp. LC2016-23 TaxID=2666330 RepID=UPI0012AFAF03|nr:hypothetical protein [Flavobacterium sp. LC2016-23]MRX40531.1 hypothetical protein [Flavobacterium sp. LC2016-23]